MSRLSIAVVVAGALALSACKKPKAEDCEAALRNWFTLVYWETAEKEIAAAPADQRDALRAAKLADRDHKLAEGMDLGIRQCRAAGDFKGVKCMKEARTATQAKACREPK